MATNNIVNKTAPFPCFSAFLSTGVNNVTGDGYVYKIICTEERTDTTNSYDNSTGIYLTPIKGNYSFYYSILFQAGLGTFDFADYFDAYIEIDGTRYAVNTIIGRGRQNNFYGANAYLTMGSNCTLSLDAEKSVSLYFVGYDGIRAHGIIGGGNTSFSGYCLF